MSQYDEKFLKQSVELATQNVANGGGPFGAVIVKDGKVIATGSNRVTANNDPTAHAEVCAIREACRVLNNFELKGCVLYSSCEPCPMCLSAIYWTRLDAVYFAATRFDAKDAGFDDEFIYEELALPTEQRRVLIKNPKTQQATAPFIAWEKLTTRIRY
jgi:guanine deaminase